MARLFWCAVDDRETPELSDSQCPVVRSSTARSLFTVASSAFVSVQGDGQEYDEFFSPQHRQRRFFRCLDFNRLACWDWDRRLLSSPGLLQICDEQLRTASRSPWLGKTLKNVNNRGNTWWLAADGPSWRAGNAKHLQVRKVNYVNAGKGPAADSLPFGSMYECISCDAIASNQRITGIMGNYVELCELPAPATHEWSADCPLPRILCINLMLPSDSTGKTDPGCNYVAFFHIKPEVVEELKKGGRNAYNCIRMFKEFCQHPAGVPDTRLQQTPRDGRRKLNEASGLFKVISFCENLHELNLSFFPRKTLSAFNGKPAVITKGGHVAKANPDAGPPGEWMEVDIDVRKLNCLALGNLFQYHDKYLPLAAFHFGFFIQAVNDDDLPEGLICDMHVFGIDMKKIHRI